MNLNRDVRNASPADRDLVASIITLAFANDPLWCHAMARPGQGAAHHLQFWLPFVDGALRYPCTWLAGDGEAASIWIPPGESELTADQEEHLAGLAAKYLGPAAGDYLELLTRFDAAHPRSEPHYYLTLLGTHPDHRGRGIGMGLLARNLELIDAAGLPAYLESSNPANNRRYATLGFEPIGEFSYPRNGPKVTTMWRAGRHSPGDTGD